MSRNDRRGPGRIRFGVSKKLLLSVILMTVLICAISTISGYFQYDNTIRKLYNDNGYVVGNVILDNIDHDKVGHYAQTWTEDEDYAKIADYLKEVESASGVAFIYIITVNEDHTLPARPSDPATRSGPTLTRCGKPGPRESGRTATSCAIPRSTAT